MTIDNEQLISLLAQRTGLDQGQISEQFTKLVDRIQQAEEGQQPLDIEGFGTFECIGNLLHFKPADILETEINNKYTGMRPIELIGAFKEPGGEDVPVADVPEKQEVLDYKDLPKDQQHVNEEEVEQTDSAEKKRPEPVPVSDVSVPETKTDTPEAEESIAEEQPKEVSPAATSEKGEEITETKDSDPLGKAILILAIIIALAVAGWMAYDLGLFEESADPNGPSSEAMEEQTGNTDTPADQNAPGQVSKDVNGDDAVANTVNASVSSDESAAENNESPGSTVSNEPYGLYGDFNQDIDTGYFTIVVHSLRTMDLAEEKKQGLMEENFRTKINEASVNNGTYYRVGIGQFPTVEAALQQVKELPEPYKSNNFITRF